MSEAFSFGKEIPEGAIFIKWLDARFNENKNILGVELGATGSGKSYRDLRKMELWYKYKFKSKVPEENICFSVLEIMNLLNSGKLRKGELLMFEEAGVNLGSLDFQNKISKMMTYVLQSFRSMNIGILFNLPNLSMLNKQARLLLHYYGESMGIDYKNETNTCKFKVIQVNQVSGKPYPKYPVVKQCGKYVKVKRFVFTMPSPYLTEIYERKKSQFLSGLTNQYVKDLNIIQEKKYIKELTPRQKQVYDLYHQGLTQTKIAGILQLNTSTVTRCVEDIRKKGYSMPKKLENKALCITLVKEQPPQSHYEIPENLSIDLPATTA